MDEKDILKDAISFFENKILDNFDNLIENDYEVVKKLKVILCLVDDTNFRFSYEAEVLLGLTNSIKKFFKDSYYSLLLGDNNVTSLHLRVICERLIILNVLLKHRTICNDWFYWQYYSAPDDLLVKKLFPNEDYDKWKSETDNNLQIKYKESWHKIKKNPYGWAYKIDLKSFTLFELSLVQSTKSLYKMFKEISDRVHNNLSYNFNIFTITDLYYYSSIMSALLDVFIDTLKPFVKDKTKIKDYDVQTLILLELFQNYLNE